MASGSTRRTICCRQTQRGCRAAGPFCARPVRIEKSRGGRRRRGVAFGAAPTGGRFKQHAESAARRWLRKWNKFHPSIRTCFKLNPTVDKGPSWSDGQARLGPVGTVPSGRRRQAGRRASARGRPSWKFAKLFAGSRQPACPRLENALTASLSTSCSGGLLEKQPGSNIIQRSKAPRTNGTYELAARSPFRAIASNR